jgi:MOSC domain-containing protein YiiM
VAGHLLRLSVKPRIQGEHGLPKFAVDELRVTGDGAQGDYNNYRMRKLAGDPNQAILVLTDEIIRQLNAEGWPVRPGDLGENLTLGGVPEASLQAGTRLVLGEVCLELTLRCDPCTELYTLPYVGAERGPEFVRTLVDRRGWYARVISPGVLRPDTPVAVTQLARGAGA